MLAFLIKDDRVLLEDNYFNVYAVQKNLLILGGLW